MDHAELSPSAASRWLKCTPSVHFSKDITQTTSVYAEEGVKAHKLAELMYDNKPYPEYPDDMVVYVKEYVDFIKGLSKRAKVAYTEQRYDLTKYIPNSFGTSDFTAIKDNTLIVVDLKYGTGIQVYADENPQLKLYALGALNKLGSFLYKIELVEMHIFQPRLDHHDVVTIPVGALTNWAEYTVKPAAQAAHSGIGQFVAGSHCRFCPSKHMCKEYSQMCSKAVVLEFRDSDKLSDDEIEEILNVADESIKYYKSMKDYALKQLLKGNKVQGYKLVNGRSTRKLISEENLIKTAIEQGHKKSDLFETSLLGIGKLEKLIGKKVIASHFEKQPSAPVLAKLNDRRACFCKKEK